jgi:hypothetical protein
MVIRTVVCKVGAQILITLWRACKLGIVADDGLDVSIAASPAFRIRVEAEEV